MAALGRATLVALIASFTITPRQSVAQLMKCRLPNGSLYVGISPPPDCGPVSNARERGPSDSATSSKPAKAVPTPTPSAKQTEEEDRPTVDQDTP
jgi:hypothetical protein